MGGTHFRPDLADMMFDTTRLIKHEHQRSPLAYARLSSAYIRLEYGIYNAANGSSPTVKFTGLVGMSCSAKTSSSG